MVSHQSTSVSTGNTFGSHPSSFRVGELVLSGGYFHFVVWPHTVAHSTGTLFMLGDGKKRPGTVVRIFFGTLTDRCRHIVDSVRNIPYGSNLVDLLSLTDDDHLHLSPVSERMYRQMAPLESPNETAIFSKRVFRQS